MNPFAVLGLPATADLTDEQVRAAWRDIAAATHPDRTDGGDPARYAAASTAFAALRTGWGRSEALADLTDTAPAPAPPPAAEPPGSHAAAAIHALALLPARARHGRPVRILARALIAAAIALAAVAVIGGTASAPAVAAGAALWWVMTARADLAPPPGR